MSKVFTITDGLENLGAFRTGGQGSVYKGRRTGEIITAVKLLPTPIINESEDNKSFRDFKNEVEKLKKVNENPSPNVVKILSSGLSDSGSFPFIEMEYIEGHDLEELLKPPHDPVFTIKEAVKVTEQLTNALAHCHSVGVKHGDVKSNNVKYNAFTGNYVLLDFGLAIMSDEQRRTSLRQAGAIEFMAPEQYEGSMLFESDIYSFGVVIYELLAGQVPFPLSDNGETARNNVRLSHIEAPIPDVLEIRKKNLPVAWTADQQRREMQVPQWMLSLLDKCLQKKPGNRFSNGAALQDFIIQNTITQNQLDLIKDASRHEEYQHLIAEKDMEITALKEQLQHAVKRSRSGIKIPAPLFFLTLILFSSAIAFAGYTVLKKSHSPGTTENNVVQPLTPIRETGNQTIAAAIPPPVVLDIDSIKNEEMRQRAIAASARKQQQEAEAGKQKKKKGFFRALFGKKNK